MKSTFVILYLVSIGTSFYFLYKQKIKAFGFSLMIIAIPVSLVIFYNVDRVSRIVMEGNKIILEMKELKKELYAKVETVKKLGEEMATIGAFNLAHVGRWVPENFTQRIYEKRESLTKLLNGVGSDEETIEEVVDVIDSVIKRDLTNSVVKKVEVMIVDKLKNGQQIDREAILKRLREVFKEYEVNETREKVIDYLKSLDVYDEEIPDMLDRLEEFLKTGEL